MPPSTVFSYWRRDHRRSSASPAPPAAQPTLRAAGTSHAPQLPLISDSMALAATFDETFITSRDASSTQTPAEYLSDLDGEKTTFTVSAIDAPSPSTVPLAVPPSSAEEDRIRPQSSPEERDRGLSTLTSQSNDSQPSLSPLSPDQTHEDASKPNSPFRLSFGKGLLNPQSVENHSKYSGTPVTVPSSHLRFRASPDESQGDRATMSQREYRVEGSNSRRLVDRDVPTEQAQHVPHKPGKTMLQLLNPMSLLAKRRSSQIAGLRAEDVNRGGRNLVPAIPDDYDPRIRGNIVHDFSAPRPRRHLSAAPVLLHEPSSRANPSSNGAQNAHAGNEVYVSANEGGDMPLQWAERGRRQSEHLPMFKEHFDDDEKVLQIENKAYLQSALLTDPSLRDSDPYAIPVFARNLPSSITGEEKPPQEASGAKKDSRNGAADEAVSKVGQDPDTIEIGQHQLSGLPRHFKSNASRFSFDMNGVGSSTQEKLLEEKHKEKEAARRAQAQLEDGEFSDDDDYDNDMLDDVDGLEEKIPGVNVDEDEDDEFRDFSGPGHILSKSSWLAPELSPVIASPVNPEVPLPQDDQCSPSEHNDAQRSSARYSSSSSIYSAPGLTSGVTLEDGPGESLTAPPKPLEDDDDDLYFDDGEFGDLGAQGGEEKFDESVFDDPTSHLYERKQAAQSTAALQSKGAEATTASKTILSEPQEFGGLKHAPSIVTDYRKTAPKRFGSIAENMPNLGTAKAHTGILSEHNLEAFHNALADAANQAATKDRFGRSTSISERSQGQESSTQTVDSHPGLMSDDSHLSQTVDMISFDEVFEDFNYDDNDDLLYDDPIIAAANAEALENDDEGFYGQEFGFYAHASGNASELTNGGYFGPRGVEGISRTHSGRGKFREPSLTPITERSEWSTRNSIISVTAHGAAAAAHSNQSVPSPGLAQLVDMGNLDDEMTLGALMRLRRGAWGGSNGSLRSSSGSPPLHPLSASNRGSFALSDVSPTVHTVPPDFLGGPAAVDSPI